MLIKIQSFEVMNLQDFFEGMSRVAATVHVVTTDGEAGMAGITVSAMSSVTADPPTLLICIHEESPTCQKIKTNGKFCVNVLQAHHSNWSESFAGLLPFDEMATLSSEAWKKGKLDIPVFRESLVIFECQIAQNIQIGTHRIFFGEIKHIQYQDGSPLIYVNRGYMSESD